MSKKHLRDMVGYGSNGKKIKWPNNARIAVQIVLNYEEGAENCVLNELKKCLNLLDGIKVESVSN